jgi:hypothetical protein
MVVIDLFNVIALFRGYKIQDRYLTTEITKSLYGYYMGYSCYLLNDGFIWHWIAPPKTLKGKAN